MTGLRQRKKEEVRQNILKAAAQVFQSQGYGNTTMADIALQANAGVGTCYNYFPSKAYLFCESLIFSREEVLRQIDQVDYNREDPSEVLLQVLNLAVDLIAPMEKRFLQEVIMSMTEVYAQQLKSSSLILRRIVRQRYAVFEECQKRGLIRADLDIDEMMICLFSILLVQLAAYALDEDMTLTELRQSLDRKVRLFFQDKVNHSAPVKVATGEEV